MLYTCAEAPTDECAGSADGSVKQWSVASGVALWSLQPNVTPAQEVSF
jgi:hypothetical protein